MMLFTRTVALAALLALAPAWAAEPSPAFTWPPTPEMRARMTELQMAISDPAATAQARADARAELNRLLRSPAAAPANENALPKARTPLAVAPPITLPAPAPYVPRDTDPPVAHVVPAPRAIPPFIDPQTGRTLVPSGQVVIDPTTGRAFPQVPGGYVNPGSGRVVRPR